MSVSAGSPAAPTSHRRRKGFIIAGLSVDAFGLVALVAGLELVAAGTEKECVSLYSVCGEDTSKRDRGIATLVVSGVALAVGTPLLVIGLQKVPVESTPQPRVAVGPRSAALHWSF